MALEFLGAVLIALGILVLYSIVSAKMDDKHFMAAAGSALVLLLFGLAFLDVSAAVFWNKVKAVLVLLAGLFMLVKFPDILGYQRKEFGNTGVFIGLALVVLGIYWLLF